MSDSIEEAMKRIDNAFDRFDASMDANFNRLDARIDAIFSKMDATFGRIDGQLRDLRFDVSGLRQEAREDSAMTRLMIVGGAFLVVLTIAGCVVGFGIALS